MTSNNMQKRGQILANRCSHCKEALKSVGHLLLHYGWSSMLWNLVGQLRHSVSAETVQEELRAWFGICINKEEEKKNPLYPCG